jgi:hypothetical protein
MSFRKLPAADDDFVDVREFHTPIYQFREVFRTVTFLLLQFAHG